MIQALSKPITFEEFIDSYPNQTESRYELRRGVIIEMPKPRGKHSRVAGFLNGIFFSEIVRLNLALFVPRECIVRTTEDSGYEPDCAVLESAAVEQEPDWEKRSVIANGTSLAIVVEVVSTNWRDDYYLKLSDYEAMGIREYWVVDYAALGGRKFIGNPKTPTISIYKIVEGEYQVQQFRGADLIISNVFPELVITAEQVFAAGA